MMKVVVNLVKMVCLLLLFNLIATGTAYAYLDPASGSYILQILTAFFFAALFSVKLFWNKIKSFFKKSDRSRKPDSEE